MGHKYRLGQLVKLQASRLATRIGARVYEVVRLLPENNGEFGYRIKEITELGERAVGEYEITPTTAPR